MKLEAETLKIDSYDTNFLPFLLVPRHLITSNENRILVNVVNILFYFFRDA